MVSPGVEAVAAKVTAACDAGGLSLAAIFATHSSAVIVAAAFRPVSAVAVGALSTAAVI